METAKYLLANECSLTMHSLESTLATGESLACVGKYNTLAELLEALPQSNAHAVVVDRFLLGDAPPAFVQYFGERPEMRLIAFCPNDCARLDPLPLISLGAVAILGKDVTPSEFKTAVCGESYHFNQWLTRPHLHKAMRQQKEPPPSPLVLAMREKEVLLLLCKEKSNKEIAHTMCVSVRTVEGIRRTLMDKTNSETLAGLVKYALQNGLLK